MIVPGHLWEEWPEVYFKFLRFRVNSIRERKMKKLFVLLALLGTTLMAAEKTVFDFTLNSIEGQATPLGSFKGKVVLLVNVASRCGFTPQYAGLEALYEKYKDRGFVILGIPANNFGAQEPGRSEEHTSELQSRQYLVCRLLLEKK